MTIGFMIPEPFEMSYQMYEVFNDKPAKSSVNIAIYIHYFLRLFLCSSSIFLSVSLLILLAVSFCFNIYYLRWMTVLLPVYSFIWLGDLKS
jgi:hypothetical protein